MTTVSSERTSLWRRIPARGPWLIICLFLLAGLIAAALYDLYGRQTPVVENMVPQAAKELPPDVQARAAALAEENRKLEEELDRQRSQPIDCPPGQHPEQKASAPTNRVSPVVGAAAGLPPGAVKDIPATGKAPILSNKELSDRLEKSTVLVLTSNGIATGFFIGPQTIVTNRHAIETATDGVIFVTSRSLGAVQRVRLTNATPGAAQVGAPDFAILRMDGAVAPATLALTPEAPKLAAVYTAGYPGLSVIRDAGFRRLIKGDAFSAPDLNLTRGEVQSHQTSPAGLPMIVHTASVLGGNSGGPLVDNCGRVVGVNTFIAVDQQQSGRLNYAQSSGALVQFLKNNNIGAQTDPRPCD
jgi:serine protease Do